MKDNNLRQNNRLVRHCAQDMTGNYTANIVLTWTCCYRKQTFLWRSIRLPLKEFDGTVRQRHTLSVARAQGVLVITDHSMLVLEALTDLDHATVLHMQREFAKCLAIPATSRLCDEKGHQSCRPSTP